MTLEEIFDVVDRQGRVVGQATRRQCHGDPRLIHQAVHVIIFDRQGRLLMQKRSSQKDLQPDKWDISVGGHVQQGERPDEGARRELQEELGVAVAKLEPAYEYIWESAIETELIRAYVTLQEGPFRPDPAEVAEVRFWSFAEIQGQLQGDAFTPQFQSEFERVRAWWQRKQSSLTHFTR